MAPPSPHKSAPRAALALSAGLLALSACTCGEPATERAYEVGAAVKELPGSHQSSLAAMVPAPVALFVAMDSPTQALAAMRGSPRVAALFSPALLDAVALSDAGATTRALRMRLGELSQLPLPESSLSSLLDGPLVVAARTGKLEPDFLLVKRLAPRIAASWKLAQVLQGVHPALSEVRVERYRGLPLRKVLLDSRRRLTYFVLRDLLVAGTSDEWVKQSLDLALGGVGAAASGQEAVRSALSEGKGAALLAVVDSEELRGGGGKASLGALLLAQTRWARAMLWPGRPLQLSLSRTPAAAKALEGVKSGSLLAKYAPRTALLAVSRSVDLGATLASLPAAGAAKALQEELGRLTGPALGKESFWLLDGVDPESEAMRHVVGLRLLPAAKGEELVVELSTRLLAEPRTSQREAGHLVICGGDRALCLTSDGSALLASNSLAALRSALAVSEGRQPPLLPPGQSPDLAWVDAPALSAALSRTIVAPGEEGSESPDSSEVRQRTEPALKALRDLGPLLTVLTATAPGVLTGEVRAGPSP